MSEFNETDLQEWLELSFEKDISIYRAIGYVYYFSDQDKRMRAYNYAKSKLLK